MKFKIGDKIMGWHDCVSYSHTVAGEITAIDEETEEYVVMHPKDPKFSGILLDNESVRFEGMKWSQIAVFWERILQFQEQERDYRTLIKRAIYSSNSK